MNLARILRQSPIKIPFRPVPDRIHRSPPIRPRQHEGSSLASGNALESVAALQALAEEAQAHWAQINKHVETLRTDLSAAESASGAPSRSSVPLKRAAGSMNAMRATCGEATSWQERFNNGCASLAAIIDRMEAENRRLQAELSQRQAELAAAEALRHQAEADRLALRGAELRLERNMRSLSWRVTEPLRVIDGLFRGGPAQRRALLDRLSPRHLLRLRLLRLRLLRLHPKAVGGYSSSVATRPAHRIREEGVSIIVCVHNALSDVRRCLVSVLASTLPPFELVLIDDGSDVETRQFLATFAADHQATLIRHATAQGYTRAANKGLASAKMPWLLLLNSDTVVSDGWLDRLVAAGVQHQRIGLVGPVSNTASWQSVPAVEEGGDWAPNPLPRGMDIAEMSLLVGAASRRQVIDLPFLNGFCLLIRRSMLDAVGPFDEEAFGTGFGEENDYCIRARRAGWRLVVADDVYIHHAQSRSYSRERRLKLAQKADDALARKWPWREIGPAVECCRTHLALAASRERVLSLLKHRSASRADQRRFEGKRLAFALPSGGGAGGTNVVLQEIAALREAGVDVWIVNLATNRPGFEQAYPDSDVPCLYVRNTAEARVVLGGAQPGFDAVIATLYSTIDWLPRCPTIRYGYYIQDYEPWFFAPDDTEHELARLSYARRSDAVLLTKTHWTCAKVADLAPGRPVVVGPSVDTRQFMPPNRAPRGPEAVLSIVAMVRVDANRQRRAPGLTAQVLRRLAERFGKRIAIAIFGSTRAQLREAGIEFTGLRNLGILGRAQCAALLQEADVFCDFSEWQAMGLTALEAMACGCATVVPEQGGASEFAVDNINALVVDSADEQACFDAVARLIEDHALRQRLQLQAIAAATRCEPWGAAYALMDALFPVTEQGCAAPHD